jgi:hypothetical protein
VVLSSTHQLWLSLARDVAYEQALPLPPGRTVFNSTTGELVSALIGAQKLLRMLYEEAQSDAYPIGSAAVTSLQVPESRDAGRFMLGLLDGGKYLITIDSGAISCYDILAGRVIASILIYEEVEMWNTISRLESDGTETCILVFHLSPLGSPATM